MTERDVPRAAALASPERTSTSPERMTAPTERTVFVRSPARLDLSWY